MYWFKNLEAKDFSGARAYFTDLDHRVIDISLKQDNYEKNLERKLKTLLLTKNTVSLGATHLATEFAFNFFKKNPILLNEGLITPALRRDRNDFSELFNNKNIPKEKQNELVGFYHDNVKQVVRWDLNKNSGWFKKTLLKDLNNKGSVLRNNLKLDEIAIKTLSQKISEEKNLSRETIEFFIADFSENKKIIFRNYRELLYSISGARIVNCESALPQENYINYSLTDIEKRQTLLNEHQIFRKFFLELTFESIKNKPLNIELLDYLSFNDIIELRQIFDNTEFKDKYNTLIQNTIKLIEKDNDDSLFNMNELMSIRSELQKNFKIVIDKEIAHFFEKLKAKKKITNTINFTKGTFSIGIGVAGIFNPIASIIGVAFDSPAYLMNSFKVLKNNTDIKNENQYIKEKQKILNTIVDRNDFKDKTLLTDSLSTITNYVFNDLLI
jgi:hypothetical protein